MALMNKEMMLAAIRKRAEERQAKELAKGLVQQIELRHIPLAPMAQLPQVSTGANDGSKPSATSPLQSSQSTSATKAPQEFTWNAEQQEAVDMAAKFRAFCLIGAAGTGKTTVARECIRQTIDYICQKYGKTYVELDKEIAIVSFTRRAVRNIAKSVDSVGGKKFCSTVHKFLEYQPVKEDYVDENGFPKTKTVFQPMVTLGNPSLDTLLVIVEESSMLGYDSLYRELYEACPHAIFIFIGDLNQLPPVFGKAVLGFKLAELPVVELTHVYRQALESPIIWFQHNYTLKGKAVSDSVLEEVTAKATDEKGLSFIPFKSQAEPDTLCDAVANYMMKQYNAGVYDPTEDVFLIPFNKSFGTIGINLHFAEYLSISRQDVIHEIIAGYNKLYHAVGDFVMYEKEEYYITGIERNMSYYGEQPKTPSSKLSRFGFYRGEGVAEFESDLPPDFDNILDALAGDNTSGESATLKASHVVTLQNTTTNELIKISAAGKVRNVELGYCMTVHKAQGSEWRKVWLIVHKEHRNMLTREMLYTGMTRAREKLNVLYSPATRIGMRDSSINKCLARSVIPGIGWQAKVEAFKGDLKRGDTGGWQEPAEHPYFLEGGDREYHSTASPYEYEDEDKEEYYD